MTVTRITLPDGVQTIAMDGTDRITGRPGDTVRVSPTQADAIRTHVANRTGPPAGQRFAFGTRRGRTCPACHRLWNVWTLECRCGRPTEPEFDQTRERIRDDPARPVDCPAC